MKIRKLESKVESKEKKPLVNDTLKQAILTGDKKLVDKAIKEISKDL